MNALADSQLSNSRREPPPLRQRAQVHLLGWAAIAALAVLAAVGLARGIVSGAVPYPACGFNMMTGLPCPGCGGTRSLVALGSFDVAGALALNPLISVLALAAWGAVPFALLDATLNRRRMIARCGRALSSPAVPWVITGALLANWIYLLLASAS